MRYFLFGGEAYYPLGGFNDFILSSNDLPELISHAKDEQDEEGAYIDWWHIFDSEAGKIIAGTEYQGYGAENLPSDIELF